MNELITWLRKEANRNSQIQGEKKADGSKAHSCNRRRTFRHRAHQLGQTADALGLVTEENKRLEDAGNHLLKAGCNKDNQIFEHLKRIEQLEAALHPGEQACDCCTRQTYKGETFWMIECQCGNHDDIGRAQAWCSMANSYEGATGKSVSAGNSGNG